MSKIQICHSSSPIPPVRTLLATHSHADSEVTSGGRYGQMSMEDQVVRRLLAPQPQADSVSTPGGPFVQISIPEDADLTTITINSPPRYPIIQKTSTETPTAPTPPHVVWAN